ncbi:hypothetical protein D3C79_770200 [compost metagenome]
MRVDRLVPGGEFLAVRLRQVLQVELFAQPAGARREYALGMFVAEAGRGVKRFDRGLQLLVGVVCAILGEEERIIVHIAAPATQLGGFVMAQGNPVRGVGQLLDTALVQHGRGMNRGAGTQRQGSEAFEHIGQLLLDDAEKGETRPGWGGSSCA